MEDEVLAPGSEHARPSAHPPIDVSGNFTVHVSAASPSNISPSSSNPKKPQENPRKAKNNREKMRKKQEKQEQAGT